MSQDLRSVTRYQGKNRFKEKVQDIAGRMLVSTDSSVGIIYDDEGNVVDLSAAGVTGLDARVTALEADAMLKTVYDADDDGLVDRVDEKRELLTIASNGQTAFTLAAVPLQPSLSTVTFNTLTAKYGVDYTIVGTALTWISAVPLATTDTLEIIYR